VIPYEWNKFVNYVVTTLALRSRPKHGLARLGQEGSPGITPHAPKSVGKCEGMSPHTSKGRFHFGSWSPDGLMNFHRTITRAKTQWIEKFLISLESS